jgi:GntR family transcriptional regulator/MocR family aminotransferase
MGGKPGFPGAARAFAAAGAAVVPIPVDGQGLDFDAAVKMAPHAKLVYVTPSHHFPTGCTMSLQRRLELLLWAKNRNLWIIEDDYDSEFRYHGRPLPALQGLDAHGHVIYCGTFNNVLFPGLRLDYAVLPRELIEPMMAARTLLDLHIATLNQAVIADFIQEDHFVRHIRRMRKHYATRKDALVSALQAQSNGLIEIGDSNGGMHICGWLPDHINDEQIHLAAAAEGIQVVPLSRFYQSQSKRMGLVLGFTACKEEDLYTGVAKLLQIIISSHTSSVIK